MLEALYRAEVTGLTVSRVLGHGGGVETSYLHLSGFNTQVGEKVSAGQRIAASGNSGGISTGPHLHFMLNVNGVGKDPVVYLRQFGLTP